MKNLLIIPSILLIGLISCNSGGSSSGSSTDSTTTMQTDTTKMQSDTSHAAINTAPQDSLLAIPSGAKVFFKNLKDGQTVSSPVKVEMGADNISVDSAGKIKPNSGHFHLLIDAGDSTPTGIVVPKDSTHLHFGNAQREATLTLKPGSHRLALQLADGIHRSYGAALAKAITVTVK